MPGKHKDPTISFRPGPWERAIIEQRAAMSGMYKKDFITQSCIYSAITVEGRQEDVQRIIDALHDMLIELKEIAGQIQSGDLLLSDEDHQEIKRDHLALLLTAIDILDGAAYLFDKEPPSLRRKWKEELQLKQLQDILEQD